MIRFVKESNKQINTILLNFDFCKKNSTFVKSGILILQIFALILCVPHLVISVEKVVPTSTTVSLYWTASGDNGRVGQASHYDIRYSTTPITEQNWNLALKAKGLPTPRYSGSAESALVYGLKPSTNYYFAMKVADAFPNWSTLSNVHMRRTTSPPICGDINESGAVDITDLVYFVKFLFIDNTPLYNMQAIDLDSSGDVDISDLLYMIDYLFGNSNSVDCP